MGGEQTVDSPLGAAAETSGERAAETFSLLANETRLAILLALWEVYEPYASDDAVSFSALRDRVGIRQGAQFNYHLDQLVGRFVEKTEDGYALRRAGHELVRIVVAGTGIEDASREPVEISTDCPFCAARTAVTYQDEWLYIVCTECGGSFQGDGRPEWLLSGTEFDPAGLTDRRPEMMWRAGWLAGKSHSQLAVEGVCDACSGPITQSLDVCSDHEQELVDEHPPRVRVTIRYEGDELSLLLDETLDIVEIERSD
jgi:hypothetical protein